MVELQTSVVGESPEPINFAKAIPSENTQLFANQDETDRQLLDLEECADGSIELIVEKGTRFVLLSTNEDSENIKITAIESSDNSIAYLKYNDGNEKFVKFVLQGLKNKEATT